MNWVLQMREPGGQEVTGLRSSLMCGGSWRVVLRSMGLIEGGGVWEVCRGGSAFDELDEQAGGLVAKASIGGSGRPCQDLDEKSFEVGGCCASRFDELKEIGQEGRVRGLTGQGVASHLGGVGGSPIETVEAQSHGGEGILGAHGLHLAHVDFREFFNSLDWG